MRNTGFTLAEVLITLGIIGIVAAMTLPTVIGNYQKKQTVARLQKVYTILSQAVKLSENENGSVDDWDFNLNSQEFYNRYLKKYLVETKNKKISQITNFPNYKNLNGTRNNGYILSGNSLCSELADGVLIFISFFGNSNYKAIGIDINGYSKPNIVGKDVFYFSIQKKYGFNVYGFNQTYSGESFGSTFDRNKLKGNETNACKKGYNGTWCSALIIHDGWEIKDDYPW